MENTACLPQLAHTGCLLAHIPTSVTTTIFIINFLLNPAGVSLKKLNCWSRQWGHFTYHRLFSVLSKNLDLFLQYQIAVAKAIIALHAQDIIHNDIQGANIIIEKNGSQLLIHLIDFACARFVHEPVTLYEDPKYLAPEIKNTGCSTELRATPALDVYAFGSLMDAYLKYLETTPEVKHQLEKIIGQCRELDPQARPSLSTVIQQLKAVKSEEPVVSPIAVEPDIVQSKNQSAFFQSSPLKEPLLDQEKPAGCLKQCCVIL